MNYTGWSRGKKSTHVREYIEFCNVNNINPDLRRPNLAHADLSYLNLKNVDARGASFAFVNFRGSTMNNCDMRGAQLVGADMRWVNAWRLDLRDTNCNDLRLDGAELLFTKVDPSTFKHAIVKGAKIGFTVEFVDSNSERNDV